MWHKTDEGEPHASSLLFGRVTLARRPPDVLDDLFRRQVGGVGLRIRDGVVSEGSVPMVYCVSTAGLSLIGSKRRATIGDGKLSWVGKINEGTRVLPSVRPLMVQR